MALASLLLVGCGTGTSAPTAADPEPTPGSSTSQTSTPVRPLERFPLTVGYPETNGDDGSPVEVTGTSGLDELVPCDEAAWTPQSPVAPVDLIGATYTGEAEDCAASASPGTRTRQQRRGWSPT
jgi:hypothetical protein